MNKCKKLFLGGYGYMSYKYGHVGVYPRWVGMGIALRRIAFAVIASAAFGALAADSLTMADFNHKIKLQVDGYTGSETLVNFPVLVRISESSIPGFLYADMSAWNNAHTQTYGHDLAFFTEDGTPLCGHVRLEQRPYPDIRP